MRLRVSDLMSTALVTVRPRDTIERADMDMRLAGIRHFPVIDDRNRLVGIISDRDLLRAFGVPDTRLIVIADLMTTKIRTITADALAEEAVELLIENKIGCLPVVGDDGQLVGLVTETDFLEVAQRALSGAALAR